MAQTARQTTRRAARRRPASGKAPPYDPRVLVFACNWCSYAGADTAGISRLQQTPHFRLLRVMCSGRVHPAHVLRAFAQGADGVMVSGCHPGDCHYRFGNYRAMEQYERTRALVGLLGLDERRLRLEWVSAAEGLRFAELMNTFIEEVREVGPSPLTPETPAPAEPSAPDLATSGIFNCLECGRCTAVCPIASHQHFSPRRLVSRALSMGAERLRTEPALWTCLTCRACQGVCPMGIDFDRFVLAARAQAVASAPPLTPPLPVAPDPEAAAPAAETAPPAAEQPPAEIVPCSHGGVFEQIRALMARPGLRQERLGWLPEDVPVEVLADGQAARGEDLLFVGCSPYFAAYFGGETGTGLQSSLQGTLRLLAQAGVRPALLANERCCGHHAEIAGQRDLAAALAARVGEQLRASGVRRVITHCPECLVALRAIVAAAGLEVRVLHMSEALAAERAAPAATGVNPAPLTYQDPCRLGRYAGLYDPPRELLRSLPGTTLVEMPRHGARAVCCGNTAWLNCNAATHRFQAERLAEAAATGATRLVTACPGCYLHLRCAQAGLSGPAAEIEITDLWDLLARSLPPARRSAGARNTPRRRSRASRGTG